MPTAPRFLDNRLPRAAADRVEHAALFQCHGFAPTMRALAASYQGCIAHLVPQGKAGAKRRQAVFLPGSRI